MSPPSGSFPRCTSVSALRATFGPFLRLFLPSVTTGLDPALASAYESWWTHRTLQRLRWKRAVGACWIVLGTAAYAICYTLLGAAPSGGAGIGLSSCIVYLVPCMLAVAFALAVRLRSQWKASTLPRVGAAVCWLIAFCMLVGGVGRADVDSSPAGFAFAIYTVSRPDWSYGASASTSLSLLLLPPAYIGAWAVATTQCIPPTSIVRIPPASFYTPRALCARSSFLRSAAVASAYPVSRGLLVDVHLPRALVLFVVVLLGVFIAREHELVWLAHVEHIMASKAEEEKTDALLALTLPPAMVTRLKVGLPLPTCAIKFSPNSPTAMLISCQWAPLF